MTPAPLPPDDDEEEDDIWRFGSNLSLPAPFENNYIILYNIIYIIMQVWHEQRDSRFPSRSLKKRIPRTHRNFGTTRPTLEVWNWRSSQSQKACFSAIEEEARSLWKKNHVPSYMCFSYVLPTLKRRDSNVMWFTCHTAWCWQPMLMSHTLRPDCPSTPHDSLKNSRSIFLKGGNGASPITGRL